MDGFQSIISIRPDGGVGLPEVSVNSDTGKVTSTFEEMGKIVSGVYDNSGRPGAIAAIEASLDAAFGNTSSGSEVSSTPGTTSSGPSATPGSSTTPTGTTATITVRGPSNNSPGTTPSKPTLVVPKPSPPMSKVYVLPPPSSTPGSKPITPVVPKPSPPTSKVSVAPPGSAPGSAVGPAAGPAPGPGPALGPAPAPGPGPAVGPAPGPAPGPAVVAGGGGKGGGGGGKAGGGAAAGSAPGPSGPGAKTSKSGLTREEMEERQKDLERAAQNLRDLAWDRDIMYQTVNILDKTGQFTQTVLSYIPGVSIFTGAFLSGARATAESLGRNEGVDNAIGKGLVAGIINAGATAVFRPDVSDAAIGAAKKSFSYAAEEASSRGFFSALGAALGSLGLGMKHAGVVADRAAWGTVKDMDMSVVGKATVNPVISLAVSAVAAPNRNSK